MNKNFIKATLFAAFMFVATGAFVSCQDYDDDISGLQEQIDGIKTGSIAPIEQQLTALKEADKALQGNDEVMKASIAALESTKNDYIAADKALGDALKVLINGKVDQAAYDKAVKDLNAAVKGLEGKNADLAKKFEDLAGQLAVFKTEVGSANEATKKAMKEAQELMIKTAAEINGKIAALEASKTTMAQVQAEIGKSTTEVKALITALENGSIKDLKTATAKNLKLIQDNQAQLATIAGVIKGLENQDVILKNAFEAGDKVLAEADKAIYKAIEAQGLRITELDTRFTDLLGGYVKTSVFDAYKTANGEALSGLTGRIDGLAGTLEGLKAQMKTDSLTLQNQINTLKKFNTDSKFQAQIDALDKKIGDEKAGLIKLINDTNASIEKSKQDLTGLIASAANDQKIINDGQILINKDVAAQLLAMTTEYRNGINTLNANLNALTGRVDVLEARVQSIVYIPEYTDGVVPQYFVGTAASAKKGKLVMKFRVSPAAVAKEIKQGHISFAFQKLQSRAAATPEMWATDVKASDAEPGIISVTVETEGDKFTYKSQNAIALMLKTVADVTNGQNADITSGYVRVEGVNLLDGTTLDNAFKVSPAANVTVKYTDISDHRFLNDFTAQRASDGRNIELLGFEKGWTVIKINGLVSSTVNDPTIKTYLDNCKFQLSGDKQSVKIKAGQNLPANIGESIALTLKNEATGFYKDITYTIVRSDAASGDYGDISKGNVLVDHSNVFVWDNSRNGEQVYELTNEPLVGLIPTMDGATVLAELGKAMGANVKTQVLNDAGNSYVATGPKDATLKVVNGKMCVVLPVGGVWKTNDLRTIFTTTTYGDIQVRAILNASYNKNELARHQPARWIGNVYFVEYPKPTKGTALTITHDLNTGYYENAGVKFGFKLKKTISDGKTPPTFSVPSGVTINPTTGMISFSEKVDLSKVVIISAMTVGTNVVSTEEYGVRMSYPVKEAFEGLTIAPYAKEDVIQGTSYTWTEQGTKTKVYLTLKDRYGNSLLNNAALTVGEWTTTYGLTSLTFDYESNNIAGGTTPALGEEQIIIDSTTGALSFNGQVNLTQPIEVKVKVTVKNKYGVSESIFTIPVEATI